MMEIETFVPFAQLVIGLGSTGSKIVDHMKRVVESPTFKGSLSTEFLVIDTDRLDELKNVDKDRRIVIEKPHRDRIFTVGGWCPSREYLNVIASAFGLGKIRAGAPILLASDCSAIIKSKIAELVEKLFRRGHNNIAVAYVVCAGGGTGSGFLPHMIEMVSDIVTQFTQTSPLNIVLIILPLEGEPREEKINAYSLIKELAFMRGRLGANIPLVFLIERQVVGRPKDLPELITNFLIDFSFIRVKSSNPRLLDQADLTAFLTDIARKNFFAILGIHQVKFPIEELNWYYTTKRFIDEKQKELLLLEEKLKAERKTREELNEELIELRKKQKEQYIPDEELNRKIAEKENMMKKPTLADLMNEKEKLIKEFKNLQEKYDKCEKKILGERFSQDLEDISRNLDKAKEGLKDIDAYFKSAESALDETTGSEGIKRAKDKMYDLEKVKESVLSYLENPPLSSHTEIVPLSKAAIDYIEKKIVTSEGIVPVEKHSFRELMTLLYGEESFDARTNNRVRQGRLKPDLLANYLFNPELREMQDKLLEGLPEDQKNRLKGYLKQAGARILVSSNLLNVDENLPETFSGKSFSDDWNIASSSLKILGIPKDLPIRRFTYLTYVIIGGLSFQRLTKRIPSSLPTLDRFSEEYYSADIKENLIHHSYLLPRVSDRSRWFEDARLSIPGWIEKTEYTANAFEVAEFLKSYPIEGIEGISFLLERWVMNTYASLSSILGKIQNNIQTLDFEMEEIKIPKSYTRIGLSDLKDSFINVINNLTEISNNLQNISAHIDTQNTEYQSSLFSSLEFIKLADKSQRENLLRTLENPIKGCESAINEIQKILFPHIDNICEKLRNLTTSEDYTKFRDSILEEKLGYRERKDLEELDSAVGEVKKTLSSLKIRKEELAPKLDPLNQSLKDIRNVLTS